MNIDVIRHRLNKHCEYDEIMLIYYPYRDKNEYLCDPLSTRRTLRTTRKYRKCTFMKLCINNNT